MEVPKHASQLAGFALAHAIWNVSDTTAEELLCPLAIVERDGARQLSRFEAETQEQAIALGKSDMAQSIRAGETFAFAHEGLWRTEGEARDVVVVEFWADGMPSAVTLIQPFERATECEAFHIIGPILVAQVDAAGTSRVLKDVHSGIASHEHAAKFFHTNTQ